MPREPQRRAVSIPAMNGMTNHLLLNGLNRTRNEGWPTLRATATELEQRGYHGIAGLLQKLPTVPELLALAVTILKVLTLARDMG